MQSSSPTSRSTGPTTPQRQRKREHLRDSGSGNSTATTSRLQQTNENQTTIKTATSKDLQSPDQERRLTSLVRNASDSLESGQHQQHQQELSKKFEEERRSRLIEAEFVDESLRDQTLKRPPSLQSISLNSTKEQTKLDRTNQLQENNRLSRNCNHHHHHHTHQRVAAKHREIEVNDSESYEGQRLISGKDSNFKQNLGCSTNLDCCCCCCLSNKEFNEKQTGEILGKMSKKAQTISLIPAYFIAELIGTLLIVLIGDGAIAAYVLTKRQVDIFCACFGFGVGAMIATFVSGKISGAHLNPAATLAFALDGRIKWILVPIYMIAQYLGGFLGALILILNYNEAINSLDGGEHSAFGSSNSTGNIFATYPAPYVSVWGSLMDQIVGTAVLLFSLSAISDTKNSALDTRHQPLIVAFVIGLVCVAFSPNCGAIFNPARDLSPRLITAIFGYPSVWTPIEGTYWILAGVVGPHIGAIIGVFAYKYLIGSALKAHDRHAQLMVDMHNGHMNDFRDKTQRITQMQHYQQTQQQTPRRQELEDYGSAR